MPYRYEATEKFWAGFYDLKDSQKESVRQVWKIFRQGPSMPACVPTRFIGSAPTTAKQYIPWSLKAI
jgi:hypothetical protein